jgi:hypothetical protein
MLLIMMQESAHPWWWSFAKGGSAVGRGERKESWRIMEAEVAEGREGFTQMVFTLLPAVHVSRGRTMEDVSGLVQIESKEEVRARDMQS